MSDVASSGTLITSALETVGYYYQSHILDALMGEGSVGIGIGGGAISSIATLVYVVAAIVALTSYVLTQHHKFALWFFLGPGLFYCVTTYRIEAVGANWIFGDESRSQELKDAVTNTTLGYSATATNIPKPRVSWLFDGFNVFISESSKSLVKLITSHRMQADLRFVVRNQLYGVMTTSMINDQTFQELLHVAMLKDCQDVALAAERATQQALSPEDREAAKWILLTPKQLKLSPGAKEYIANLKLDYPDLWNKMAVPHADPSAAPNASPVKQPAEIDITELIDRMDEEKERVWGNNNWTYNDRDRMEKLAAVMKDLENTTFNCDEIWNFSFVGLHRFAKQIVDSTTDKVKQMGLDPKVILDDWKEAAGYKVTQDPYSPEGTKETADQTRAIYRALAKQLFHNEAIVGSPGAMMAKIATEGSENRSLSIEGEHELSAVERLKNDNIQWQERSRLMYTAASIPYYQGILLYVLATAYPFFCFLLLIPNRHSSYLMFFTLWFWVKSWDIGFAVVMLLDEIFFTIFTGGIASSYEAKGTSPALSNHLEIAISAMKGTDPTFNISTYYNVIAVAINAVPLVMSYLTLGSLKGGAGLIAEGIKSYADVFARVSWKAASEYGVGGTRLQTLDQRMSDAADYIENDSGGRAGLKQQLHSDSGLEQLYSQRAPGARHLWTGYGHSVRDLEALTKQGAAMAGAIEGGKGNIWDIAGLMKTEHWNNAPSSARMKVLDKGAEFFGKFQKFTREEYADHLERLATWAAIDSVTSRRSLEAMKHGRIYDVFELPYMDMETDGNRVEFDIALKDDQRYWDFTGEFIDTLTTLGSDLTLDYSFRNGLLRGERNINGKDALRTAAVVGVGAAVGLTVATLEKENHDPARWNYSGGEGNFPGGEPIYRDGKPYYPPPGERPYPREIDIRNKRHDRLSPLDHSKYASDVRDGHDPSNPGIDPGVDGARIGLEEIVDYAEQRGIEERELDDARHLLEGSDGSQQRYDDARRRVKDAIQRHYAKPAKGS